MPLCLLFDFHTLLVAQLTGVSSAPESFTKFFTSVLIWLQDDPIFSDVLPLEYVDISFLFCACYVKGAIKGKWGINI